MDTMISYIGGLWYAYGVDTKRYNVYGLGKGRNMYMARFTDEGIKYVSRGYKSRSGAYSMAKKHGNYIGVC